MRNGTLAEGRAAIARGWLITPLHGKMPTVKGWTTAPQMSDGELNAAAYNDRNYGVRTGNGLIVADVDRGCSADILKQLLDIRTPTVRTGSGGYHFYFSGSGRCSVGKVSEHLDIRGEGGQVVGAGSIHPDTGEPYTWIIHPDECPLAPYPPFLDALTKQAERIRKAPAGKRNDTLNRAAFAAARAGAATSELAHAAVEAGLDNAEIEATLASGTKAGKMFAPKFDMDEILVPGEHFMSGGEVVTMDQTTFIETCWARIPEGVFYSRFGLTGEISAGVFQACDVSRFRGKVSKYLPTYAWIRDGKVIEKEYRNFSQDMGSLVLSAGQDYTPNIEAITFYPVSRGPHLGWLVMGEHKTEPVTDHAALWEEVLCDFPFKDKNALYSMVCCALTLIMRPRINGPVPAFMIRATQERTGKTKLVTEFLSAIYGREISNLAIGDDDAELDKRLAARNLSCHTVTAFDNIRGKLDSSVLCAYLTSTYYSARILGQSKNVEFPVKSITVLTANNPSMTGEVAKRMVQIQLESKVDHPEARTDFKHPNLRAYLAEMRPRLLGSLLAIAEMEGPAFIQGGYEEWGRLAGGAMAAAGMPLSQELFAEMSAESDDTTSDIRVLIDRWAESYGTQALSVDEVLAQVKGLGIMPRIQDAPTERAQMIRMGFALRDINGRVFGAWKVTCEGMGSRRIWRLARV
jgi:hypothetical protein